ncbi:hypothetical protein PO124_15760 [Bacillus licheniformis]|nr:hypothetical protein [Bacillus licheniformis]
MAVRLYAARLSPADIVMGVILIATECIGFYSSWSLYASMEGKKREPESWAIKTIGRALIFSLQLITRSAMC